MSWQAFWRWVSGTRPASPGRVAAPPAVCPGPYRSLQVYLRGRFAARVVLTLSEIEDLVGFPLPQQARVDTGWWSGGHADTSLQAIAWTLAGRVAVPNLQARTVAFERRE